MREEITISSESAAFVANLLANELVKFGFGSDENDSHIESVIEALRCADRIVIKPAE
jgi:hypothetical protein